MGIIANLDGGVSRFVHHALEKFIKCSSNTVEFTKCYETINNKAFNVTDSVCIGPGNVIFNLVRRNCPDVVPFEYSSLTTVNLFHEHELQLQEDKK